MRGHHRRRQPGAHRRQRVVEQQRVRHVGPVVAREPDLVHAVVEGDDPVLGHHLADVVDDPLRRQREAALGRAVADAAAGCSSRSGSSAEAVVQPALEPVGQQRQARADIADHLGMREVDLLDIGRREADMDHLRPARAHEEGRLLDRVVADGDDQVGAVDRLVHVVPLRQRGRAHDRDSCAAGHRALAHLGVEERNPGAPDELGQPGGQAAAGWPPRPASPAAARPPGSSPAARSSAAGVRHRHLDRVRRHQRHVRRFFAGDVLGQLQVHRPRPLLLATRNASRTKVGMVAVLTICRAILVSGVMVATTSTIWNRACRLVMIPFWPVIMTIGIAPRCA